MDLLLEEVSVGYNSRPVISDINLSSVNPGSLVAVLGSNAAGKSTLLKSLAGQLKYRGRITIQQQALNKMTSQQRIRTIGYLPQTLPQATTLIAYELVYNACRAANEELARHKIEQRTEAVFERLGIRDLALMKMQEMSGGQRQMIGLAQVLVRQTKLLLLDEPTSALDLHWQLSVLQAIREETVTSQVIAFIASHDLSLAVRFCDKLLVLSAGRVLAIGTPEEVLTTENLRSAYGVEGRIEFCSKGYPIVLADRACV